MKLGDHLQACADCGDVFLLAVSTTLHGTRRPLCPTCLRAETHRSKQVAEVWLLEQMYLRSAA